MISLSNLLISKLYSLIKNNNPPRPIVSFIMTPCARLRRLILMLISQTNSDLINNMKQINLIKSFKFIYFHVNKLFPSSPAIKTINLINDLQQKSKNHIYSFKKNDILIV